MSPPLSSSQMIVPSLPLPFVLPLRCAGCPAEPDWAGSGGPSCERCGLLQSEVAVFWRDAVRSYEAARADARVGRFEDARAHLARAYNSGLPTDHEAARRFDALCRAAVGDWNTIVPDELPESWCDAAFAEKSEATENYRCARRLAIAGEFAEALPLTMRAVEVAPWLLPAHRLLAVVREAAAAERAAVVAETSTMKVAEAATTESASETPSPAAASPAVDLPAPAPPVVLPSSVAVPPMPQIPPALLAPADRFYLRAGSGLSAFACFFALFAVWRVAQPPQRPAENVAPSTREQLPAVATIVRPTPLPDARPQISKPISKPATLAVAATAKTALELPLPRDLRDEHDAATLALAQRWFNEAHRARQAGEYERAGQLAQAVYDLVPNSHLGDEALLLRAQAADNGNYSSAARLYEELATRYPQSPYAAVARRQAERIRRGEDGDDANATAKRAAAPIQSKTRTISERGSGDL